MYEVTSRDPSQVSFAPIGMGHSLGACTCGFCEIKTFFVAIDLHSKWPEIISMSSTTTSKSNEVLCDIFARNGIPHQLVIRSSPYHPATNGAAQRLIQTMKQTFRANHQEGIPLEKSLSSLLLQYRATQHTTTGVMPCSLFVGRELPIRLHLLSPNVGAHVRDQQSQQKDHHDRSSTTAREFDIGETLWARNFHNGPSGSRPWFLIVLDRPLSYLVRL